MVEQENQVIGYAHLDQTDLVAGPSVELVVDPKFRGAEVGRQLLSKAIEICGKELRLWVHGDQPAANALATSFGFEKIRTVLQMSKPLTDIQQLPDLSKEVGKDIMIRSFLPGIDNDAWLALNNNVFKEHPEQGNWQSVDLNIRMSEEWFDEKGFFLAEINNKIIGSTWTKIHASYTHQHQGELESHAHPAIGEIYITSVHQEYSGRGIGKALTITALNHLKYKELGNAMLYVESDNKLAYRFYESLNFRVKNRTLVYQK